MTLKVHPGQSVCYPSARDIAALIAEHRIRAVHEFELQAGLERIFKAADYTFDKEVRLNDRDRIDFVVQGMHGPIGIEVKVDGSVQTVTTQLHRYAQLETLHELMLVTTRSKHKAMPDSFNGKTINVVHIAGFL